MRPKPEDYWHLGAGCIAMLLGILSLAWDWHAVAIVLMLLINVYMFALFVETGLRSSDRSSGPKGPNIMSLPNRFWGPLQLLVLFIAAVSCFARLYIHTDAIQHVVSDKGYEAVDSAEVASDEQPNASEYLSDEIDAFYFSLVTITTLGYGDYAPASPTARHIVIWELVTTAQLVLFAFPLVTSRLSDY